MRTMPPFIYGVRLATASRSGLAKTRVGQLDQLVAEIASASQEQSQGITQVNTAVTQMDKITQGNAASAEESASASEKLSAQADALEDSVAALQRLVGGASATHPPERPAAPAARTARTQSPAARKSPIGPASGNGGYERDPGATLFAAPTAGNGMELPLAAASRIANGTRSNSKHQTLPMNKHHL